MERLTSNCVHKLECGIIIRVSGVQVPPPLPNSIEPLESGRFQGHFLGDQWRFQRPRHARQPRPPAAAGPLAAPRRSRLERRRS